MNIFGGFPIFYFHKVVSTLRIRNWASESWSNLPLSLSFLKPEVYVTTSLMFFLLFSAWCTRCSGPILYKFSVSRFLHHPWANIRSSSVPESLQYKEQPGNVESRHKATYVQPYFLLILLTTAILKSVQNIW